MSEHYYQTNGYYQQFIDYYATLLKYAGILIPNANGKSLSTSHISKRYNSAMDYVEKMNLPVWLERCARRALIYGVYYGLRVDTGKNSFGVIDLPVQYCKTDFRDSDGNDIIQFDVRYFSTILNEKAKKEILNLFPKEVKTEYAKYKDGKIKGINDYWVVIPVDFGVCFTMFDGRPNLLKILPAILDYEESVELEHEKDISSIEKIIVQKIPHLNDGRLVFEPDEAAEMHDGSVQMLKTAKTVRVLTTYADVDSISSNPNTADIDEKLTRIEQNIYAQAGVSGQIFAPNGSSSLPTALNNDLAKMMHLANKFSLFITHLINSLFGNSNISFKYSILPISYYNASDVIEDSYKLVNSGYSFLIPALAQGLNQRDLLGVKDLENDLLKLNEKLIPLKTAYTSSAADQKNESSASSDKNQQSAQSASNPDQTGGSTGGRPELPIQEKSAKTVGDKDAKH